MYSMSIRCISHCRWRWMKVPVWQRRSCYSGAENEEVDHQFHVLCDERGELEPINDTVRIKVIHVFIRHLYVFLRWHVTREIVDDNEAHEAEEHEVDLFAEPLQSDLEHNYWLPLLCVPCTNETVNAVAPLVEENVRRIKIRGLQTYRKEFAAICFVS